MEIKIDLDMDRIDYNAINAKILEKSMIISLKKQCVVFI